jgi:aspartyl-tRNA(Asn)/glutamyl-tRNA(Gln) amidotransferase subunit A
MSITKLTALELGRLIRERKISSPEATTEIFKNIDEREPKVNAYISLFRDEAIAAAREVQKKIDAGEIDSALAGVPMSVKDLISSKGYLTTCASKTLSVYKPVFDAAVIEKLNDAGAVLIGKNNMDEFAMGGSTETSYYGQTRNPWDLERVPGGSSGGAAAAVAAGETFYALGSDTGGSIRQPCAFCGITGIKPTYGAVSRYGLIAYASSLDQIGPMGKDADDCAAILSIISGPDKKDMTSIIKERFNFEAEYDLKSLKIGMPKQYFGPGLDPSIKKLIFDAADVFKKLGARVEYFDFGESSASIDCAVPAYYIIACAEASSNLSRYDGIKYGYAAPAENLADIYINSRSEGFGMEVKRRIMLGSYVLSSGYFDAYYKKALQARRLISETFTRFLDRYDIILSPVAPTTAYKIGENISDPIKMYMGDVYTVSVNLAGLPALAAPCGFDENGLPAGFQLIGAPFSEPVLVAAARAYQKNTDFHKRSANVCESNKV